MSSGSHGLFGGPHASDGSIQSFYNFLDPGNISGKANSSDIAANFLDPGNMFGMNPAADPTLNGQAGPLDPQGGPMVLPTLGGNYAPFIYNPHSFVARPGGGGAFNNMAQAMAGPMYVPTLLPRMPAPQQRMQAPSSQGGFMQGVLPLSQQVIRKVKS